MARIVAFDAPGCGSSVIPRSSTTPMQQLSLTPYGVLALAALVVAVGSPQARCIEFWLSETDAVDGSVTQSNVTSLLDEGATGQQMRIWVRPDADLTLKNISLNLRSTNPGVIEFTDVIVHNPQLVPGGVGNPVHRFEFATGDPNTPGQVTIEPDIVSNFTGFTVSNRDKTGAGLGPLTQPVDNLYDSAADAFLLATVDYDFVGFGGTQLFLQIGAIGLNQTEGGVQRGSEEEEVIFGGSVPPDEPPLNGEADRNMDSATADGAIVTSWWINPANRSDVDNDLSVLPLDALLVINEINQRRISDPADNTLPDPDVFGQDPPPFVDVSGDRLMTPLDALLVINDINRQTLGVSATAAIDAGATSGNYSVPEPATWQLALLATAVILQALRLRSAGLRHAGGWSRRSVSQ